MKKPLILTSVLATVCALGIGAASLASSFKGTKKVSADTEQNHYIPFAAFDTPSSEHWSYATEGEPEVTEPNGIVADRENAKYWDNNHRFFALDNFYRGELNEKWTGTITSPEWTQKNRYIYYTLGGNSSNQIKFVADGIGNRTINIDISNGNPMIVNYYKIPIDFISDVQLSSGVTMHLELIDNTTGDYGFHNFGYLHVNATQEDVATAVWNHIDYTCTLRNTEEERFRAHWIMQHYNDNDKYDGIRDYAGVARTSVNEDFEDNSTFLGRWFRDPMYNDGNFDGMNEGTIISDFEYSDFL